MGAHLPLPGGSNGDLTLRQQQQRSLFFLFRPVLTAHKLQITIFSFHPSCAIKPQCRDIIFFKAFNSKLQSLHRLCSRQTDIRQPKFIGYIFISDEQNCWVTTVLREREHQVISEMIGSLRRRFFLEYLRFFAHLHSFALQMHILSNTSTVTVIRLDK